LPQFATIRFVGRDACRVGIAPHRRCSVLSRPLRASDLTGNFGFVRAQNHLFRRCFPPFIPRFFRFSAKRTQLVFFLNLFIPKYFHIFQLGSFGKNTLLYRELHPNHDLEFAPRRPSPFQRTAPILLQYLQTSKCTLEGLEGLEGFLSYSYPVAVTALRITGATVCRCRNLFSSPLCAGLPTSQFSGRAVSSLPD
jgi:hypothetical protein